VEEAPVDLVIVALVWAGIVIVSLVVVSYLAVRWGRDPFGWALLAAVLGPIAIVGLLGTHRSDVERATGTFEQFRGARRESSADLRVLAAVDGSAASASLARHIVAHYAPETCEAVLLAVLPMEAQERAGGQQQQEHQRTVDSMTGEARRLLEAAGVPVRVVVGYGAPGETILRLADEEGAGMIVVGRRGAGLSRALLGSVSEHVVKNAKQPVTIVD
jgi:nucleotide-binding universal stress UspA family protein